MYREVSCYDKDTTEDIVQEAIFTALEYNFDGVSVPQYYLPIATNLIPPGFVVASSVDYPGGLSSMAVRCHSILATARRGANAIDLVANNNLLLNRKFKKFREDIESCYKVCQDNGCSLRAMLEYRTYDRNSLLITACEILKDIGIDYVFLATDSMVNPLVDCVLTGHFVQKTKNLNVICNASIWKPSDYKKVENSGIFGVRIKSINAIKNVFGVL